MASPPSYQSRYLLHTLFYFIYLCALWKPSVGEWWWCPSFLTISTWFVKIVTKKRSWKNQIQLLHVLLLATSDLKLYLKDRLKKLVVLSPSFCINSLSYLGKENLQTLCINDAKPRSSIKDLRQNKHQLLHRITSVKTTLIHNNCIYPNNFNTVT